MAKVGVAYVVEGGQILALGGVVENGVVLLSEGLPDGVVLGIKSHYSKLFFDTFPSVRGGVASGRGGGVVAVGGERGGGKGIRFSFLVRPQQSRLAGNRNFS